MATGRGSESMSIGKGSDIIYDFSCSPCSKEGQNVEAIKFCVECNESLCSTCLKFHNRFEMMRDHQLLDGVPTTAKGQQGGSPLLPKEKCPIHQGKGIDMYCGTHDVVCCAACIAVSHRPCQGVEFIPLMANSLKKGKEVDNVKLAINKVKSGFGRLKRSKEADLNRIEQQKLSILTQIKDYRDSINKQLDSMEKTAKDELQTKYKTFEDQIKADLKAIGEMIATLETKASELSTFDGDNESQLFVYVKQSKVSTKEGDILMNEMEKSVAKETLRFAVDSTFTDTLCKFKSLGIISDYNLNQYNVKVSSDKSTCCISGSCILADGSILIADETNKKVKQLDQSYKVTAECDLPCGVSAVCRTGPSEVAIALFEDKKVQFATVTHKITLTRSFRVGDICPGLAYSEGELFVTCGGRKSEGPGQVEVYNTKGKLLRSFQKDSAGKKIFSIPYQVTVSLCGKKIHIADGDNGVITMDRDGNKQRGFTDPELKHTIGVCVTDDDSVLVCGLHSHTILQIGTDGQKKAVLLRECDGIRYPISLLYDTANTRLIATMEDSDHINVYDITIGG